MMPDASQDNAKQLTKSTESPHHEAGVEGNPSTTKNDLRDRHFTGEPPVWNPFILDELLVMFLMISIRLTLWVPTTDRGNEGSAGPDLVPWRLRHPGSC